MNVNGHAPAWVKSALSALAAGLLSTVGWAFLTISSHSSEIAVLQAEKDHASAQLDRLEHRLERVEGKIDRLLSVKK